MSALVRFDNVSIAFGEQSILSGANLKIEANERVCLIGRNGSGKSSTLKLITGFLDPDEGDIDRSANAKISVLNQMLAEASEQSVRNFISDGMRDHLVHIQNY